MATIFEFICYHVRVAGWLRNGRSEQSGQLRQQAQEPYMSGKVQTTCRSDYIATCPEKKVQNSVSVKNGTNFHLFTKWRIHNSPKPSRRLQHHATGYPSMWWRDHGWKALKIFDRQKCQYLRGTQVEARPIFSIHRIPYLFFRTSPDIIWYSRCPDFSGHVRCPA